ncbi:tRNA lysidine(34) synthetase TilS [Hydrogenophaga sp.]|uniref:tRNA lysidine(34) synthetase TilS n=1 Tax=Hydrogenophaga sp. TaxID=1904254 RepID=UPI0025BAC42B|nr:tRNA lysidine(34) synthetase TilS [Hydrogenophaga sp.]
MDRWCARWLPDPSGFIAVAYSAGADSTALLLAARERWPSRAVALHVHHGLQAAADGFESHGRAFCEQLGLPFSSSRVQAAHEQGQSPEEAARDKRYRALADMAQQAGAACVLLGQHADDQAETLMLALSRGAGLPGLAAMAERFERHGVVFGRPLLGLPSQVLREWLLAQGHAFVDDPTNTDPRYTRNRIRSLLLPAWEACFPGFRPMLARSARHAAQAQTLLDDLAGIDMAQTGAPPAILVLKALSRERQANVLRRWLRSSAGVAASTVQLDELLDQIADCTTRGHRIRIKVASGFVTREGERLAFVPPDNTPPI